MSNQDFKPEPVEHRVPSDFQDLFACCFVRLTCLNGASFRRFNIRDVGEVSYEY